MNDSNRPIVITLIVVLLAIAGIVAYFFSASNNQAEVTEQIELPPPPVVAPEPAAVIESAPTPEPELAEEVVLIPDEVAPETPNAPPAFVLPLLDDSDQLIRDGAVSLTRHEGINLWLGPSELIRKFVAFVDNVAHGQVAKAPVRALAPNGAFLVRPIDENRFELDTASYDRYDWIADIAGSIDARRAAEFYHLLRPLVHEAYSELGYGDKSFDDVLFQAMARLLEAPVIEAPIVLVRPVVMYRFEDPKLEERSAVQKQMIRMGPANTRRIQSQVEAIRLELRAILER